MDMNSLNDMEIIAIAMDFLKKNYDYVWLKAMLYKASKLRGGVLFV